MALHSLNKPQAVASVHGTANQGHPHYWRTGARRWTKGAGAEVDKQKDLSSGYTGLSFTTVWRNTCLFFPYFKKPLLTKREKKRK